jgi:hypothetical protein
VAIIAVVGYGVHVDDESDAGRKTIAFEFQVRGQCMLRRE